MSLEPWRQIPQNYREWTRWCAAQGTFRRILKLVDETKNSDATYAYDAELSLVVRANRQYLFRGAVWFDTALTPDFKFQFNGPASPAVIRTLGWYQVPGTSVIVGFNDVAYAQSNTLLGTSTTGGFIAFQGLLVNGANEGEFGLQWAQNTSNASATTVLSGSYMEYEQL